MTSVRENLQGIQTEIARAVGKTGRQSSNVTLVAVTKSATVERIREAREAGVHVFAENRIQDAALKIPEFRDGVVWRLVGHLQRNKIKTALNLFDTFDAVDSVRLAEDLNSAAAEAGKTVDVLLEVNLSGEPQRFGFSAEALYSAIEAIGAFDHLRVTGLMGIAPHPADEAEKRRAFAKLRNLFSVCKGLKISNVQMKHLSMGMSDDFGLAIEEGANMVRIGRRLFQ